MKIEVIGYSGSGKSTLAKKLGELYGIPVLHMDNTKFYGNWEERTEEEQTAMVQKFLDENESWVIDGNYTKICTQRFEQTDMTIYLNFNRFSCYFAALKRAKKHKHVHRESCPCNDKFDLSFQKWILFGSRTKERRKKHMDNLNRTKGKKVILKNRKQVNKFLEELRKELEQK